MDKKDFQKNFEKLFIESGLTQEVFGKSFGANKPQVQRWRTGAGEPNTVMLSQIARGCKVSLDWLLGLTNIRTPIETIAAHRADGDILDLPQEAQESIAAIKTEIRKIYLKKNSK